MPSKHTKHVVMSPMVQYMVNKDAKDNEMSASALLNEAYLVWRSYQRIEGAEDATDTATDELRRITQYVKKKGVKF